MDGEGPPKEERTKARERQEKEKTRGKTGAKNKVEEGSVAEPAVEQTMVGTTAGQTGQQRQVRREDGKKTEK